MEFKAGVEVFHIYRYGFHRAGVIVDMSGDEIRVRHIPGRVGLYIHADLKPVIRRTWTTTQADRALQGRY